MAQLSLQHVTKRFPASRCGEVAAVRGLDLEILDREFLVIVGPSGCGKTTTLRLIAGLETPTTGHIHIDGRAMDGVPAKDRGIAMVFQNCALYPFMTAAENIAFNLFSERLSPAEIERRVAEAAAIMGIREQLGQKPGALSGGQQRRVAVARALVRRPRVFLFDEPLTNLEPTLRAQLRGEIKRLHERLRTTVVYVTHDHEEALALADRLVVMRDGAVQQVDTPAKVYREPASRFVAGFLGSPAMNFVDGMLHAAGSGLVFREKAPGTIEWSLPQAPRELAGRAVTLGIRPQDACPAPDPQAAATIHRGIIDLVEPIGSAAWITWQTGAHALVIRAPADLDYRAGQRLGVQFTGPGHFFDAESEVRLFGTPLLAEKKAASPA